MTAVAITTRGLTKDYGMQRGLFDLNMDVGTGEVFGFLGPNGAGKTTTIRLLMGMIFPTRGSAQVFGLDCRAGLHAPPLSIAVVDERVQEVCLSSDGLQAPRST